MGEQEFAQNAMVKAVSEAMIEQASVAEGKRSINPNLVEKV